MQIRPYQREDLEALTALISDLGYPVMKDQMNIRMDNMEAAPFYHTFVAEREGSVVGMVGCRDILSYERDGYTTQIHALITKKELQGQGIGRTLVEFTEKWAIERGANALVLTSGDKTEWQHISEFYERLGFVRSGLRYVKKL
ncbi:GNAT family N-acetyltransferase [Paenibacillus sp. JCM 10914]|uniref:GNAT family N-acetyltransferase n=1 Tax=Paenibacillus sp. JCM 10914 TaxID=1236974 RepID=UPI0003CC9436|nr:GNAT family N-acetyltransferase [Paenibacillus sp. JCM 10914]GAE08512.1 acetyltransferase, GNAT family family [Paenibacillus sp. JCM 10914]